MTEVIPAIIPRSLSDLEDKLSHIVGLVKFVQVDVLDGTLVPERSWPYLSTGVDPDFVRIIREEDGLPFWEEFDFEVDLMVGRPRNVLDQWVTAGAVRVIAHYESFSSPKEALSFVESFESDFGNRSSLVNTELGLALNIETSNEVLEPLISHLDVVEFMGIGTIGRQGEPFDSRVLRKIADLRAKFPDVIISVDGGVNLESAPRLVEAGASRLVAGSVIWKSENPQETIIELQNL
ncbi:hypothetical protein EPN83_01495 [Patescibacteria group bacterium]|nr:MAG: hypothetical protein EPN83_01495 [Patescibacteria group bacterium]